MFAGAAGTICPQKSGLYHLPSEVWVAPSAWAVFQWQLCGNSMVYLQKCSFLLAWADTSSSVWCSHRIHTVYFSEGSAEPAILPLMSTEGHQLVHSGSITQETLVTDITADTLYLEVVPWSATGELAAVHKDSHYLHVHGACLKSI